MAAQEVPTIVSGRLVGTNDISGRDIRKLKTIDVFADNTVDATNTFTVDLAQYDGSVLLGFLGYKQTTDDSVIVEEVDTSSVSGTVVTFTIAAGSDNDPRIITVFYT